MPCKTTTTTAAAAATTTTTTTTLTTEIPCGKNAIKKRTTPTKKRKRIERMSLNRNNKIETS